ncbi:MAG: hypothetical protein KF797_12085 [Flavobacteriales bacterium]|nr:hypothetical protein [Flavobacteriales bacterium]
MQTALSIAEQGHWSDELARRHAAGGTVVFTHIGLLDRAELDRLMDLSGSHCISSAVGVAMRKRLVNLVVEGLENIRRHTPDALAHTAFAQLVFESGGYRLVFGNAAPQVIVTALSHRIGILNEMDEADLREHHLKLLANDGRTERGGAGLGLLTMVRKSNRPVVAHAIPRDSGTAFLALELVLAA